MLAVTRPSTDVTAWCSSPSTSSTAVVVQAYQDAVKYFEKELSKDPRERAWIRGHTSMTDVLNEVSQAQKLYGKQSDKHVRVRQCLTAFASTFTQYSGVFDVLAQADPLHAGIAWGAIKFVFMGVKAHADTVAELLEALARIGEALPRVEADLTLYQNPWVQASVARVYAHILLFLRKAVNWYNARRMYRFMHSVLHPLMFQDTVADIKKCILDVDANANTSSHVEIRGLTIALQAQAAMLRQSDQRLLDIQMEMNKAQARNEVMFKQYIQVTTNTFDLAHTIKEDTSNMRPLIQQMHFKDILEVLRSTQLPEEVLEACESYTRRRLSWRQPGKDTMLASQRLKDWLQLTGSSMFVVKAGPRAEARTKDMAVEMTRLLSESGLPVFWYFSSPDGSQTLPSPGSVLKSLIFQALRHDLTIVSQDPRLGNIQAFQAHHTIKEWTDLAILVLSKVRECFVVVETEDLFRSVGQTGAETQLIVDTFGKVLEEVVKAGNTMKLLLVSYGTRATLPFQAAQTPSTVVSLNPPLPVVRRAKQPLVPQFRLGSGKYQLQPRLAAR